MEDLSRFSDATEAVRAVKALQQSLMQANQHLSKWMIEFSTEININTLDIVITAKKPFSSKGWIKTLSCDDVIYFQNDIPSLVRLTVNEVVDVLLKDQMYDALHDPLLKASKNVLKMMNK